MTLALSLAPARTRAEEPARVVIPARGANLEAFTPRGFHILTMKTGDLDGDGIPDHVVVYEHDPEDKPPDRPAPLVVLAGRAGGGFVLIGRSDGVAVSSDAVRFSTAFQALEIRGQTFDVQDSTGKPPYFFGDRIRRFAFRRGGWYLIGEYQHLGRIYFNRPWDEWNRYICPAVRTRRNEFCDHVERTLDYAAGTWSERWRVLRIDSDRDDPQSPRREIVQSGRLPRKGLVRLEDVHEEP